MLRVRYSGNVVLQVGGPFFSDKDQMAVPSRVFIIALFVILEIALCDNFPRLMDSNTQRIQNNVEQFLRNAETLNWYTVV